MSPGGRLGLRGQAGGLSLSVRGHAGLAVTRFRRDHKTGGGQRSGSGRASQTGVIMMVATESEPIVPQALEPVKLLLVDDDRDTLLALQAILEPLHQELLLAESGKDALRLCLDHNIAAILLDVRMPEMDGFETAELIRSRKRSRHT